MSTGDNYNCNCNQKQGFRFLVALLVIVNLFVTITVRNKESSNAKQELHKISKNVPFIQDLDINGQTLVVSPANEIPIRRVDYGVEVTVILTTLP